MTAETDIERAVVAWLAAHRAEAVDLLCELIQQPSIPGFEFGAQQVVCRHLAGLGLDVTCGDVDEATVAPLPGYSPTGRSYAGRAWVAARWPGAGSGRSLILSSHIDVTPVEEGSGWTHDPWRGEIVGERLYGRGAWDDKPGSALAIM